MRVVVTIELEEFQLKLENLPKILEEAARLALEQNKIVSQAKRFCPVDTGALRSSIREEWAGNLHIVFKAGGRDYINPKTGHWVDYARYVHEGTSKMAPRPFLRQAMYVEKNTIKKNIRKNVLVKVSE